MSDQSPPDPPPQHQPGTGGPDYEPPDTAGQPQTRPGGYEQHDGPQAWRPDGPVGASASGRKAGLVLAAAGGVVLLVAVVALLVMFLGGEGGTQSPEDAVVSFTSAISDGDCEKAEEVATDRLKDAGLCKSLTSITGGPIQVNFDNVRVTDESEQAASVDADVTLFGQTVTPTFALVHQGDEWLVDDFTVNGLGG